MSPGTLNAQIPEDGLIEAGDETEREEETEKVGE